MCRFTAESCKLLSKRLRKARKGSGVKSIEKSCAEYGLDQATAFRAIHGISNPTAATIVALSDLSPSMPGSCWRDWRSNDN